MEWIQVIVILGVFGAGYFHLSSKIDNKIDNLTLLIIDIRDRLSRIEGQLMPKVFPIQEEKPKKKAKGK